MYGALVQWGAYGCRAAHVWACMRLNVSLMHRVHWRAGLHMGYLSGLYRGTQEFIGVHGHAWDALHGMQQLVSCSYFCVLYSVLKVNAGEGFAIGSALIAALLFSHRPQNQLREVRSPLCG